MKDKHGIEMPDPMEFVELNTPTIQVSIQHTYGAVSVGKQEVKQTVIPIGAILTITVGAWSNYSISGVFKALKDIDVDYLKDKWFELHPEQNRPYDFEEDKFITWLFTSGYIEPINCYEMHLDDRGPTVEVEHLENDTCNPNT